MGSANAPYQRGNGRPCSEDGRPKRKLKMKRIAIILASCCLVFSANAADMIAGGKQDRLPRKYNPTACHRVLIWSNCDKYGRLREKQNYAANNSREGRNQSRAKSNETHSTTSPTPAAPSTPAATPTTPTPSAPSAPTTPSVSPPTPAPQTPDTPSTPSGPGDSHNGCTHE